METLLKVALVAFVVLVGVYIVHLVVWMRTGTAARGLLKATEKNLETLFTELHGVAKDVRKVADDAAAATENVKEIAASVVEVKRDAQKMFEHYKEEISSAAKAEAAGVVAGVKTGIMTLFKNVNQGKEGSS